MRRSLDRLKEWIRSNRPAFIALAIYLGIILIGLLLVELLVSPENNLQLHRLAQLVYSLGVVLLTVMLIYWLSQHNTARQQAEASLQASEAQLRTLFRAMTDVILVLDEQGCYLQIAPTSPSLLIRPPQELLGKYLRDVFPSEQAEQFLAYIRHALDTRVPVHCDYALELNHQTTWFAAIISPLTDHTVIWMARDVTEQKRRAEQIATINTIGRALAELLDLPQIYQQLTTAIQHLFPDLLALIVSQYDSEHQVFVCVYGFEEGHVLDTSLFPPIPLEPLGYGAQSESFHTRRTIIVNDLPERLKRAQTNLVVGSLPLAAVYVPLVAQGEVIGVMQVQCAKYNRFSSEDGELLSFLASTAAVAIQNARLFEAEQRQRARAEALAHLASRLNVQLELMAVVAVIVEEAAHALKAEAASIYLYEAQHDALIYFWSYGLPPFFPSRVTPLPRVIFDAFSFDAKRPIVVPDIQAQPDLPDAALYADCRLRTIAGAAMWREDRLIGVLNVKSIGQIRRFTDDELALLMTFAAQGATAVENVQLFEAAQRRTLEQAALLEASRAITSSLDLRTVLQRLAEQMGRAIDATSVYIDDWNPHTRKTTVLAEYLGPAAAPEERVSDLGVTYDVDEVLGPPYDWLEQGVPYVIHDDEATTPGPVLRHMRQYGGKSILFVPLKAKGTIFGYACLWDSRHRREFLPNEISLCQSMAQQAAIAFENARLFDAERRQLRLAQTLRDVGALLTAEMSLDEVFDYLFDLLAHVVRYDSVSIQLINDNQIMMAAGRGFTNFGHAQKAVQSTLPPTISERWARPHHRVLVIADTQRDPRWLLIAGSEHIRSWVGAALRVKGRLLGVLNVDSNTPNTYDESTGETVAAFANQAAIAIESAQLHEATRRHADELETRVGERTAALELERRRTAAILDAAGEGIVTTDIHGAIEYVNPAMERLTGYAIAETIGQNPRLWQSSQTPVSKYQKMWSTISQGGIWQGELVNRRKDGTLYDAALTIAPLFDIDGRLSGFVGIQHDISQQKELDRLKDEFVSNVSHELRTPIANVKLYLSLLTRGKPEKYEEYLQTLRREAGRLEKLIEDLLDLSRLDLGKTPIRLSPTDVNQLAAQLIADRTALAANHDLLIDYHAEGQLPYAQADQEMLVQVMSNLLTNAINYTPRGGLITATTALHQRDGQPWITFTVQDTGPGLTAKDLPHVFERFYRGEAGRKSGAPGTGLGLAISAQIMAKLDGQITVESQAGRGAAFTLWLKPA